MVGIVAVTLVAAFANGGLGYGFSSITVPVGLLYFSNRSLNPALVLVEVGANLYSLFLNRGHLRRVWRRVLSVLAGLLPAILLGSLFLKTVDSSLIRLVTYCILAPLIVVQGFGLRRPLNTDRSVGVAVGGLVGLLYSTTTVSGPPLAIILNNEGFEKGDFRAALAIIRVVESGFTALVYYSVGLFSIESIRIFEWIVPGVLVAMPLGALVLGKLPPSTFRRACISVDAWLIAYGLLQVLLKVESLPHALPYAVPALIVGLDGVSLVRFLSSQRERPLLVPASELSR